MTGHQPRVTLVLRPDGRLAIELPAAEGASRASALHDKHLASTLRQILQAQANGRIEIGTDGGPTQQQITHWERHCHSGSFPDRRCRFCVAEGRIGRAKQPPLPPAEFKPAATQEILAAARAKPQAKARGGSSTKVLAKRSDGTEIRQVSRALARSHEANAAICRCGARFSTDYAFANHLALTNPCFPQDAPEGFPHGFAPSASGKMQKAPTECGEFEF